VSRDRFGYGPAHDHWVPHRCVIDPAAGASRWFRSVGMHLTGA